MVDILDMEAIAVSATVTATTTEAMDTPVTDITTVGQVIITTTTTTMVTASSRGGIVDLLVNILPGPNNNFHTRRKAVIMRCTTN
jgi:hypothetical protein